MQIHVLGWGQRLWLIAILGVLVGDLACAENWPGWRGPRGDGTSHETAVPTHWNGMTGDQIAWKVPTPSAGHASPIVWGERVFLSGCDQQTQARELVCLHRDSGQVLWRRTVLQAPLETKHQLNSYASSTPATDGELVVAAFLEVTGETIPARNVSRARPVTPGRMVIAAFDLEGNPRWVVRPGEFVSVHGFCACPVFFENLVIVNGDHDGYSYLCALDRETGATVWKPPREHKTRSYVTPLIRQYGGRQQLILSGSKAICSYDPRTGDAIWKIDGPTEQFVASMVDDGQYLFMAAGFPTHHVMAIRPDGTGNVTNTHIAWHVTTAHCYVPSPIVVDSYLLVPDDRGTANCFDTRTGTRHWQERLGSHYSTSLFTAGGLVYFLADDGLTKIVRPGPKLEVVAENPLGEYSFASPAISQGKIFIRGEKHLYCIGTDSTANR